MNSLYSFGRDALLLETLSIVAECQDPDRFWDDAIGRLKWILDFSRVDVALRNPDDQTYTLQTVFEIRPDVPRVFKADLPLSAGIAGQMMRSGEACHCFNPGDLPFAPDAIVDVGLEGGSLLSILSVSLEANRKVLGVLSFGSKADQAYCHQDVEIATRFATHAAISLQNWQHLAKLREDAILLDNAAAELRHSHSSLESLVIERTKALHSLSQRLLKSQDEERRRVSRNLHDSTGQTLAALLMQVATLRTKLQNDQPSSQALAEIAGTATQALQEIRTTSYLLHPPLLDEVGLASAARWYAEGFAQRSGIQVNASFPSGKKRLPGNVEMVFFRLLQESLTNVHRHSGASVVNIALQETAVGVHMEVQDNGHGIAPDLLNRLQNRNGNTGVGLAGMRERLSEVNGQLEIASGATGTAFRFSIPTEA